MMFFLLPLIVLFAVTFLIIFTFKIKNIIFRWIAIILPPLLLSLWAFIPIDMITILFWIVGFIITGVSGISLLLKLISFVKTNSKNKQERHFLKIQMIKPTLAIMVFCLVLLSINLSVKSADDFALRKAQKIHRICNADQTCPEMVPGWERGVPGDWFQSVILYGRYGTKYRITYTVSDDKKSFSMTVKHNIDEAFDISGGVNKEVISKKWVAK